MAQRWGIPTWIFFHTLICKFNESNYLSNRVDILHHIKSICNVLPCPDCADHATTYLQNITAEKLPTQESFKYMLWNFHNAVNSRRGVGIHSYDNMKIYENLNLKYLLNVFIREFTRPIHNPRYFSDSMARTSRTKNLINWLSSKGLI